MPAEADIFAAINVAGVTSLIGSRIYTDVLPENCAYPAVVWVRSGTTPIDSISSIHFGDFVDFGISVWGKTRKDVDAVADAIVTALYAAKHGITGREAGYDPDTGLMATTITTNILSV